MSLCPLTSLTKRKATKQWNTVLLFRILWGHFSHSVTALVCYACVLRALFLYNHVLRSSSTKPQNQCAVVAFFKFWSQHWGKYTLYAVYQNCTLVTLCVNFDLFCIVSVSKLQTCTVISMLKLYVNQRAEFLCSPKEEHIVAAMSIRMSVCPPTDCLGLKVQEVSTRNCGR